MHMKAQSTYTANKSKPQTKFYTRLHCTSYKVQVRQGLALNLRTARFEAELNDNNVTFLGFKSVQNKSS